MPIYEFSCVCGQDLSTVRPMDAETLSKICPECGGVATRRWTSFGVKLSWPEHWNPTLGRPVTNRRDFSDGLKEASDKASERFGFEHRYVPADPQDLAD